MLMIIIIKVLIYDVKVFTLVSLSVICATYLFEEFLKPFFNLNCNSYFPVRMTNQEKKKNELDDSYMPRSNYHLRNTWVG